MLVWLERGEQRDFVEEVLVHPATGEGRVHQDATEGDAVEGPEQGSWLRGNDGRGTGSVVHEGEFAEGATGTNVCYFGTNTFWSRLDAAALVDVDVKVTFLDDVEVVARVALGDDLYTFGGNGFLDEGTKYLRGLLVVEMAEEEVVGNGCFQASKLIRGFRVEGRLPVVVRTGLRVHALSRDGRTTGQGVVGGKSFARCSSRGFEGRRRNPC